MDERVKVLAHNLVNYSMKVKKGEKVYVHCVGSTTREIAKQLIKEVYAVGGLPFIHYEDESIFRELLLNCTEEQMAYMGRRDAADMEQMDCYVKVLGADNANEYSDVPAEKMKIYNKLYLQPVHYDVRVPKTRWVVLRFPTSAMAQLANTSTDGFQEFYFNVCNLDYAKMGKAMENLVNYMKRTDKVKIVGPGTNLTFSIKDIPVIPCAGEVNIPDGEVFTAPVKDSINGTLSYNTPAVYQGFTYENIKLTFKDGKITQATANDTERINKVFDTDEGARYIGEFAIGVNPYITKAMKETLFDEKIMGSFHFTPGNSYDDAPNGNKSSIHWDLVCIQTTEYGGGEIYFDDVLIRKNGRFVVPELECLNPENLI